MVIQKRDMRDISVPAVVTEDMNSYLLLETFLVELELLDTHSEAVTLLPDSSR